MQKHCLIERQAERQNFSVRIFLALGALFVFIFAAVGSGRAGVSRMFSEYSAAVKSGAAAKQALDLEPNDPEAHYNYAVQLADVGQNAQATTEFERAAALRPADYFLWQELGRAREDSGDPSGAVSALRQAIALAPEYAQPHWQLGNVLLRSGETNSAFAEMRSAAGSDPALFPLLIDLAWGVCDRDPQTVLTTSQPQNDLERVSLARFFIDHQQVSAGMNLLQTVTAISPEDRNSLTTGLIAKQEFHAARQVWSKGSPALANAESTGLLDGGFEAAINYDNQGFGWRPTQATQTVQILLDPNEAQSGRRSLRLQYGGGFDPAVPVISQLVLLPPHTRYQLTFVVRTENLVSAALPIITVTDPRSKALIAQTDPLAAGTNGWQQFSLSFETPVAGEALVIGIQRQSCAVQPCPIFGRAWFDNFTLKS